MTYEVTCVTGRRYIVTNVEKITWEADSTALYGEDDVLVALINGAEAIVRKDNDQS